MDVKELIKWLFQIKKPDVKSPRYFQKCSKLCVSIVFVYAFVLAGCKSEVSNSYVNGDFSIDYSILNDGVSDKSFNINNTSDALTNKNVSRSIFGLDFEKRDEFRAASGIFKMIRDGANYLDQRLEENVGKDTARTFGRPVKKLQAMMIPLMFKLGVMSTLIVLTFLLALKAVVIGKILLFVKLAALLGKVLSAKGGGHGGDHEGWGQKQVHVHVHNTPAHMAPFPSSYGVSSDHQTWGRIDPYGSSHPGVASMGPGVINTPYGQYVRTGAATGAGY